MVTLKLNFGDPATGKFGKTADIDLFSLFYYTAQNSCVEQFLNSHTLLQVFVTTGRAL